MVASLDLLEDELLTFLRTNLPGIECDLHLPGSGRCWTARHRPLAGLDLPH